MDKRRMTMRRRYAVTMNEVLSELDKRTDAVRYLLTVMSDELYLLKTDVDKIARGQESMVPDWLDRKLSSKGILTLQEMYNTIQKTKGIIEKIQKHKERISRLHEVVEKLEREGE